MAIHTRVSPDPAAEFPFAVEDYLPHLVVAIYQFRDSRMDAALRTVGLNVSRYRVLGVLDRFGATSMTELANFTAMERTTLTRIADHLVAEGLIERASEGRDRRQVLLSLTEKGADTYSQGLAIVLELNRDLMRGVPEGSKRAAAHVLQQLLENLAPNDLAREGILRFSREGLEAAKA